ncbi:MAG: hypothetical protein ACX932_02985 [Gammaproteobacteria bacterium]
MLNIEQKCQKISVFEGDILPLGHFFTASELSNMGKRELILLFSIIASLNTDLVIFPSSDNKSVAPAINMHFFRELYNKSFKVIFYDKNPSYLTPGSDIIENEQCALLVNSFWNTLTIVSEPADAIVKFIQTHEQESNKQTPKVQCKISNRIFTPLLHSSDSTNTNANKRLHNRKEKVIKSFNQAFFNAGNALDVNLIEDSEGRPLLGSSRYDEVFLPITTYSLNEQSKESTTIYASTWKLPSNGIHYQLEHFVTAMCLFGHSLQGVDESNNCHPLVNPKYVFPEGITIQEITDTTITNHHSEFQVHPYEETMYQFLEKAFIFARNHGADGVHFHVHLPYTDYLLKIAKLFIKKIVTQNVFTQFLYLLTERTIIHIDKIQKLAREQGINVTIVSPLDALISEEKEEIIDLFRRVQGKDIHTPFQAMEIEGLEIEKLGEKTSKIAVTILSKFGISIDNISKKNYDSEAYENKVAEFCCDSLKKSSIENRLLWASLSPELTTSGINGLLDASNAAMIGGVTYKFPCKNSNIINVCALHTMEEKPIQQSYQKRLSDFFGEVFYMLVLPPTLLHMGGNAHNLLFRLPHLTEELTEKLTEKFSKKNNTELFYITSSDDDGTSTSPASSPSLLSVSPESNDSFPFMLTSEADVKDFIEEFYDSLIDLFCKEIPVLNKIFDTASYSEKNNLQPLVKYESPNDCLRTIFFRSKKIGEKAMSPQDISTEKKSFEF